MPSGRFLCLTALWLCLALPAGVTLAAPNAGKPGPRSAVIVFAGGSVAARATLTRRLRGSLPRAGIDVSFAEEPRLDRNEIADASSAGAVPVKLWLDLSASQSITLYVSEEAGVFVRQLTLDRGLDPVALELIDLVVTTSLGAALAGEHTDTIPHDQFRRNVGNVAPSEGGAAAVARPPGQAGPPPGGVAPSPLATSATVSPPVAAPAAAPAATPPVAPAPSAVASPPLRPDQDRAARPEAPAVARPAEHMAPTPAGWWLAALYEGNAVDSHTVAHGPGLRGGVDLGATRIALNIQSRWPDEHTGAGSTVQLVSESLRISVGRAWNMHRSFTPTVAVAVGGDVTHIQARARLPGLMATPASWALDPVVRPSLGLEFRPGGRWRCEILAGVDLGLTRPRYVLAADPRLPADVARPVWAPNLWRPFVGLAAGAAL